MWVLVRGRVLDWAEDWGMRVAVRGYRFGVFEVDLAAGELRRGGLRVRLHRQPFAVLCLLLARPGEVLTREEISRALWGEGEFVDFEHGVNAAVGRLREALRDRANAPRYVETLPRRGYRFLGAVEVVVASEVVEVEARGVVDEAGGRRWLSGVEDLPRAPAGVVRGLFALLQAMYLSFYVGALGNLEEVRELLAGLPGEGALFWAVAATAGVLIPVRIYLTCGSLFWPPGMRGRYRRIWPFLLAVDLGWAVSPLLLMHHVSFGLALACVAPLVYAPFAQRGLVLMGALGER